MTDAVAPARPARRTWDVATAIVLTVLLLVAAVLLGVAGAFLVMASDSCGGSTVCQEDRLSAGVLVAMLGPTVVALVAVAAVIERLVRARLACWVPMVGGVVAAGVWAAGAALVFNSVQS